MNKILISIVIIAITGAFEIIEANDDSIVFNIGFRYHENIFAKYSKTMMRKKDTEYYLLNTEDYATNFDGFVKKYPSVTIKTHGVAISNSTFGDVGRDKFGVLNYSTRNLWRDEYKHFVDILKTFDEKLGAHYVEVAFGIEFTKQGTKLFITPFVNGEIISHGSMERYLEIGFTVETVTFNPNTDIDSQTPIPSEQWIALKDYSMNKISEM